VRLLRGISPSWSRAAWSASNSGMERRAVRNTAIRCRLAVPGIRTDTPASRVRGVTLALHRPPSAPIGHGCEVRMARRTVMDLVRSPARSASGRFVLRVLRDLRNLALIDRGMTLAATAFTSVLPILIVAGAVRSRLDPHSRPFLAEHL